MSYFPEKSPWMCEGCKEGHASQGISCWQCGFSRNDDTTAGTSSPNKHKRFKSLGYHTLKTMMAEYKEIFRHITRRMLPLADDYREALEFGTHIYRVCIDIINHQHTAAIDVLSCMCMLDRRDIPGFLFSQSDYKSIDFKSAVRILIDMSLVAEKGKNIFEMHYLVQLGAKRRLAYDGDFQRRAAEVLNLLSDQFPTDQYANLEIYEIFEPHVQALLLNDFSSSSRGRLQRAKILHNSAWYATEKGNCLIGESRAQQAVDIRMELLGPDHEDSLSSLHLLAVAYRYQGRWKEAEKLESHYARSQIKALRGEYGDPQPMKFGSISIYGNQVQPEEAEVTKPSLRRPKEGTSKRALRTANLLSIYSRNGQWELAEEVVMQVMKTSARILGAEHPDTLNSMIDLIWIYASRQGRRKEAFSLGKELISAAENAMKSEAEHETLSAPMPLSLVFRSQEWLRGAEKLGVQVMKRSLGTFGEDHPATATSMISLLFVYENQGRWDKLEELQRQIIKIGIRAKHRRTLICLGDLIWTIPDKESIMAVQVRVQKAIAKSIGPKAFRQKASRSNPGTGSSWIEAREMGNNVDSAVSTIAEVEADRPMPDIPLNTVKNLSEVSDGPPRAELSSKISRSPSLDAIEFQQGNPMQHSEPVNRRRSDVQFRTGPNFDSTDFFRNGSPSLRRSLVDTSTLEKPEKTTQYLSKSYNDRWKKAEKSTQYLSKSYDDRLHAKNGKLIASKEEDFIPQTLSGLDYENSLQNRSKSSLTDSVNIKGPMKDDQKRLGACASGVPLHLGSKLDLENDFRRKSSSANFDATSAKQMYRQKNSSKSFVGREGSIRQGQNLAKNDPVEKIASFLPIKKNPFSQRKMESTAQKINAERRVGAFLAQHSDLKPLYEEALRRMDKDRFVDNLQKLLKKYYRDLSRGVTRDSDQVLSELLHGPTSRNRIARCIADKFNSEYNEIQAQIGQHMHETRSGNLNLDARVTEKPNSEFRSKAAKSEAFNDISNSEEETFIYETYGDENECGGFLPNTVEMEKILTRGSPFQNLSMNLEVLALPATLGSLTRLLMSIPNDRIWFSAKNDRSLSNRLKRFVEDHTEENWNWWPLKPKMRVLKSNQTRLHWRCVSIPCPQL